MQKHVRAVIELAGRGIRRGFACDGKMTIRLTIVRRNPVARPLDPVRAPFALEAAA